MVQNAADALNGYEGFFYAAGSNLAVGFANGISASAYRATLSARAMANAAKEAAESALGIQSPSKVLKRIGEYAGEGFAIGIENYVGVSEKVGTELANGVIAGASRVADVLDRSGTMEAIAASFRELSDALTETDEETSETSEESEEKTSKLADALSSMADSVDEVTSRKKDLKAFDRILNRTGVTFTNAFVDEMINSTGQFAGAISEMADLTDEQLQQMVDAFTETKLLEQINELTDSVDGDDGFIDALAEAGINILDFAKDADKLGYTLDDIASKIDDFASSISDGFSKMEIDGQTTLEEFTQNLENNWLAAKEWEANVNKVFSQISFTPLAEDFRKEVLEGGFDQWGQIMADLANSSQEEIYGFLQLWDYMRREGSKISSGVADSLVSGNFKKSGTQIAQGVADGVENGISNVTSAATLLCSSTETTVKDYFGIHSPSTLMYQVGEYMVQGLVNGIVASATELDKAFTLVNQAINFLQQLGDQGIEIQVKVTPVIDTSTFSAKLAEVQTSMGFDTGSVLSDATLNTINRVASQLSQNGSKRASSELVGAVAKLSEKIDSIDPSNFGITYQQNNYSPKALSTGEIYRKTRNQLSRYKNRYDGNSGLL